MLGRMTELSVHVSLKTRLCFSHIAVLTSVASGEESQPPDWA